MHCAACVCVFHCNTRSSSSSLKELINQVLVPSQLPSVLSRAELRRSFIISCGTGTEKGRTNAPGPRDWTALSRLASTYNNQLAAIQSQSLSERLCCLNRRRLIDRFLSALAHTRIHHPPAAHNKKRKNPSQTVASFFFFFFFFFLRETHPLCCCCMSVCVCFVTFYSRNKQKSYNTTHRHKSQGDLNAPPYPSLQIPSSAAITRSIASSL